MLTSSSLQRARAAPCRPLCRPPVATKRPRLQKQRHEERGRRETRSAICSSPIQFSSQFAQILQQSLARQSETTAEAIGLPGLVLAPGGAATTPTTGSGGSGDEDGAAAPADGSIDDGTGSFVWGAGASLAALLWRDLRDDLKGKTVLELGAGTAVVSIVAAAAGARLVVATDLPSRLAAVERNVELNRGPGRPLWREDDEAATDPDKLLRVAALDWAEGERGVARVAAEHLPASGGGSTPLFDWVLGADLTYAIVAMAPLARTVRAAMGLAEKRVAAAAAAAGGGGGGDDTSRPGDPASSRPTVLLAHRPRSRQVDAAMHAAFAEQGLELRVDQPGTACLASLLCGGGEMEGEGDGEPMVLFRAVGVAAG